MRTDRAVALKPRDEGVYADQAQVLAGYIHL
jgi:hypothetical protein